MILFCIVLSLFLWTLDLSTAVQDTSHYRTAAITVEASPVDTLMTSPHYVFSTEQIRAIPTLRLASILNLAPGIFIRDYGGFGGLKTISLRGSAAAQTSIYLDGIPLNSLQNGIVDLSIFPSTVFSQIAVFASTSLPDDIGANIGGAVHLYLPEHPAFQSIVEFGSFGYQQYSLTLPVAPNFLLFANFLSTQGNYPFDVWNFGYRITYRRRNADFRSFAMMLRGKQQWQWGSLHSLTTLTASDRGVPGPVIQGRLENRLARLGQGDFFTAVKLSLPLKSLLLEWHSLFRSSQTHFTDPELTAFGPRGLRTRYVEIQFLTQLRFLYHWHRQWSLSGNMGIRYGVLYGPLLQWKEKNNVDQQQFFTTVALHWKWNSGRIAIASKQLLLGPQLVILPQFTIMVHPWQHWQWTIQFSRNYRPPTFNEQYYRNYGNIHLRPEKSWNGDVTLTYRLAKRHQLSISLYGSTIEDLILAIPKSPVEWQAQNVGRVIRYGIETALQISLGSTNHYLSGSIQRNENRTPGSLHYGKELSYSPRWLLRYMGTLYYQPVLVGGIIEATAGRYTLLSNLPQSYLPPFVTLTVFAELSLESFIPLSIRLECHNCTDTRYAIIDQYPMPGRWLRVRLSHTTP